MAEVLVSIVDWLFQVKPRPAKAPRSKKSCDYCGTDKLGLGIKSNYKHTFCGDFCHGWYIHSVYRPLRIPASERWPKRDRRIDVC
jgi:hypothetical protein